MQYTDDVAKLFLKAATVPFMGAEVYNIRGSVVDMSEVISAIEAAAPQVRGAISYDATPLPFPDGQDDSRLTALLGPVAYTPLIDGVAATIATFRKALSDGLLTAAAL
jgi:nucleoside-diphosphate-sugar epimerase